MFNTKIYDSTNNNYNTNFDTYIIGNNNIPVNGNLYYNNKFGKLMTSFIVDSGDSILGGNVIISENTTVHGKCDFKNNLTIAGNVYIPGKIITPSSNLLSGPTGPSGTQGIMGPTGLSGTQGTVGPTGLSGTQGTVGPTGLSGTQGIAGAQGNAGISGASILPTTNTWTAINTFIPMINCSAINITNTNTNFTIGYRSLIANTTGINNTSIGTNSMVVSQTGSSNTSVGLNSLLSNIVGSNNCSFGDGAFYASTNNNNTAIGGISFITLQNGSNNTAIGYNSSKTLYSGTNNTFIGSNTSSSLATMSSSTAIGYDAQVTASNQIVIGTVAENTYVPGKLFVKNVEITGIIPPSPPNALLTVPTLYSSIFSNISLLLYDSIKNASFIDLPEGVYMIKFVLQMTSDNTLNQIGCLEYGLSYDKVACTLSKNRLEINTRSGFDINTGVVNIDSSLPYIFHEYLVRTYGVTTNLNLNVKCISYNQSLRRTFTSLKVTQSYLVANRIA